MTTVTLTLLLAALAADSAPRAAAVPCETSPVLMQARMAPAERPQRGHERTQETERITRTLKIGASGEIELSNIAGDIMIRAGRGNEATIEAVKTARAHSAAEAKEMLGLVTVEISERGNRAEARTRYPEQRRGERRNVNVSVVYNVTAPPGTRVTARSISGNVTATDMRGELALETVSGNVVISGAGRIASAKSVSGNVRIKGAQLDGSFQASSVSGAVELQEVKARRMDIGSVSGAVLLNDVHAERIDANTVSGQVDFTGPLAKGGRYSLKSHSGGVRVTVAGDMGFEVNASSFSGNVRSDLPLNVRAGDETERRRRAVRGVHGDGSAFLDLSTFSGNIVISRR